MSEHPHTPFAQQVVRRVDAVLRGEDCPWPPSDGARSLLVLLRRHVGAYEAISRAQLCELLDDNDRSIRSMVSELRMSFGVAIGTSKVAGASGYFLISTAAEMRELAQQYVAQAVTNFRVVRAVCGRHATAELYGQVRLQLDLDTEEAANASTR